MAEEIFEAGTWTEKILARIEVFLSRISVKFFDFFMMNKEAQKIISVWVSGISRRSMDRGLSRPGIIYFISRLIDSAKYLGFQGQDKYFLFFKLVGAQAIPEIFRYEQPKVVERKHH